MSTARNRAKSAGALALLTVALPANLALTAVALTAVALAVGTRRGGVRTLVPGRAAAPSPSAGSTGSPVDARTARRRTVLISGGKMTKSLALARAFAADGHRVVLAETAAYRWTGHRFSRAVDAFHVIPAPDDPGYADALASLVRAEGVDLYVPVCSPLSSIYDGAARTQLDGLCEVLHPPEAIVRTVDDKAAFAEAARSFGLAVPESHRITDPSQVTEFDFAASPGPFVLKSIAYDPVRRLDLTRIPLATPEATRAHVASLPISESNPWVMQAFAEGEEYCTHTVLRDGRVTVHCVCASSAVQLNYEAVRMPAIDAWVERFAEGIGATGQLSFDFIVDAAGEVRAIECNPRTHSAVTIFHDHPELARAYLGEVDEAIAPRPGSRPTLWLYEELWRILRGHEPLAALGRILRGKDAIFAWDDPLPFLLVHHLQIPSLLVRRLVRGTPWHHIDFNIGKLAEPGGD
ncbi:MAG: hypothetical protein Q7T55_04365 [Solirubrobacteraceae bacterium]|nr:hypothetical protein [Solirubrobacteraceae bacterium]